MSILRINFKLTGVLLAFFSLISNTGCASKSPASDVDQAQYNIQIGSSAPVHGQALTLRNGAQVFHSPVGGGALSGGWENPETLEETFDGTRIALSGKNIVPRTAQANWFSYQTQKYYTAQIALSPDLPDLIKAHAKAFGENTTEPALIFVLGPRGEMKSALKSSCSYRYVCGRNEKVTVIGYGTGEETAGDPKVYLKGTIKRIKEGRIQPIPGIEQ
jgi:hypothetical protein